MADLKPGDVVRVADDQRVPARLRGQFAFVVRTLRTRVEVELFGKTAALAMDLVKKVSHE